MNDNIYIQILENNNWNTVHTIRSDNLPRFEIWKNAISQTYNLQQQTGIKHRCVTNDNGLRAIWCDGSSYWCGF